MVSGIIFFRNLDRKHVKQEKGGNRIKFHDWVHVGIGSCKFKVARVVKKIGFYGVIFYNLVIPMKLYKIRYLNLDKALLFPRNQAICLKNWKLWRAPTTTKFNIFWWNIVHVSHLIMSTKGCSGFFKFCLDLELLIKI